MENPNWQEVREKFENEMAQKLSGLPGHKETTGKLQRLRSIISHELPELTSLKDFQTLIKLLVSGENNLVFADKILNDNLEQESRMLLDEQKLIDKLKLSASDWINENFPEERLQQLWKEHKTWLPRRFTIYKNPKIDFQTIAIDSLVRFYLYSKK